MKPKAYHLMLAIAVLCVVKFVITPTTDESIWLLPAAMGAFLIGCVMGSFADDREHGGTATRDGLVLYGVFLLVAKFGAICALLFALIMVAIH